MLDLFVGVLSIGFGVGVAVALGMYVYELLTHEYADSPYEDELNL